MPESTNLIPLAPKPGWPIWAIDYLKAMLITRTDGAAAKAIGITYQSVYEQRQRHADFDRAVMACRAYRDRLLVLDLEDVTLKRAIKGDPEDRMNASLAMFHLKARDSMYKDNAAPTTPNITINVGYQIGKKPPKFAGPTQVDDQIPEDYEVLEETKSMAPRKHLADNVLLDEDIEIDL